MKYVLPSVLVLVGFINLYPVIGVLSTGNLAALYGIHLEGSELVILMRHRAVLFGLLGSFIVLSAFRPALQPSAITAGLVSMLGFVVLAFLADDYNQAINRVVVADVVASAGLLVAIGFRSFVGGRGAADKATTSENATADGAKGFSTTRKGSS